MKILKTASRFLYALPIMLFGINHLKYGAGMAGMVPAYLPLKTFWVYFTGLAMIVATIAIMAQIKYARLAGILLGVLILMFALLIHLPGIFNPSSMQLSMTMFQKDLALAGGAFFIAAYSKK